MAIPSKDDLAQWAYIQSIYNFINKERKRLSIGADLAIPNYQDEKFSPKQMSDIQSEIEQFNNNAYVKNNSEVQTSISSIRIPNKDDFIKALPFEEQKQLLVKLLDKNQLYYNFNNIDDADVRDLISDKDYQFKVGEKIGQFVVRPVIYADFVDELSNERGGAGFGSTGR